MVFVSLFHQRASTGVTVPRETGEPNFVRLSSAKLCTMCEEPKGVEGVLARDAAKAAMTQADRPTDWRGYQLFQ